MCAPGWMGTSLPREFFWPVYGGIGFYILLVVVDLVWTVIQKLMHFLEPLDDFVMITLRKLIDFLKT
jgi:hypothetical protein